MNEILSSTHWVSLLSSDVDSFWIAFKSRYLDVLNVSNLVFSNPCLSHFLLFVKSLRKSSSSILPLSDNGSTLTSDFDKVQCLNFLKVLLFILSLNFLLKLLFTQVESPHSCSNLLLLLLPSHYLTFLICPSPLVLFHWNGNSHLLFLFPDLLLHPLLPNSALCLISKLLEKHIHSLLYGFYIYLSQSHFTI